MIRINDNYYINGTVFAWELLHWKDGKGSVNDEGNEIKPRIRYFPTLEQAYNRAVELEVVGARTIEQMANMLAQVALEIRESLKDEAGIRYRK